MIGDLYTVYLTRWRLTRSRQDNVAHGRTGVYRPSYRVNGVRWH